MMSRVSMAVAPQCAKTPTPSSGDQAAPGATLDHQLALLVIGGGAAGFFGAIRAKEEFPPLKVTIVEKAQLLAKVRISGGGRCNVTTGLHTEASTLAAQYPRGMQELRGAFFRKFGPLDTAEWFQNRGVLLKREEDGRMFPRSDTSASVVDCLTRSALDAGVEIRSRCQVQKVRQKDGGTFQAQLLPLPSEPASADFVLLATGSSLQGYRIASELGHSVVEPRPSLFTFKVADSALCKLAGVSFPWVVASLHLDGSKVPTQSGPLLITHWGLSGPAILRMSAWGARLLYDSNYQAMLTVDFVPSLNEEEVFEALSAAKRNNPKRMIGSSSPPNIPVPLRFWKYLLERQGTPVDQRWPGVAKSSMRQLAADLKRHRFQVSGKGEFKEEFVTAGGIPLTEVDLSTMESRRCPSLFFAGEVVNVDGVTGGYNFQNAWTGGFIAGTSIAEKARKIASMQVCA